MARRPIIVKVWSPGSGLIYGEADWTNGMWAIVVWASLIYGASVVRGGHGQTSKSNLRPECHCGRGH